MTYGGMKMVQYLISITALLFCTVTDLVCRKVYKLAAALYFLLAAAAHFILKDGMGNALIGTFPGIVCLTLSALTKEAIGYGDSVLILLCGFSLGLGECLSALLLAFCCSGIFAVVLLAAKKGTRKSRIAFVPFLLIGTVLTGLL